ncbi:hypothetical protein WJX72_006047 [[Myrmecia] bisecta]|uniref:AAA+ ATPase domain-containing protein n=1 Tax=[Myrmecia] bisecta TaxID=41462 RepID=A0AAW1QBI8_9CHLO
MATIIGEGLRGDSVAQTGVEGTREGPAIKEAVDETKERKAPETSVHWGTFISLFPQFPHLPLKAPLVTFGRSTSCMVQFQDPRMPSELCRVQPLLNTQMLTLQCLTGSGVLSVNGRTLKKADKVTMKGGDEITVLGSTMYGFLFRPGHATPQRAPASKPAAASPDPARSGAAAATSARSRPYRAADARLQEAGPSAEAAVASTAAALVVPVLEEPPPLDLGEAFGSHVADAEELSVQAGQAGAAASAPDGAESQPKQPARVARPEAAAEATTSMEIDSLNEVQRLTSHADPGGDHAPDGTAKLLQEGSIDALLDAIGNPAELARALRTASKSGASAEPKAVVAQSTPSGPRGAAAGRTPGAGVPVEPVLISPAGYQSSRDAERMLRTLHGQLSTSRRHSLASASRLGAAAGASAAAAGQGWPASVRALGLPVSDLMATARAANRDAAASGAKAGPDGAGPSAHAGDNAPSPSQATKAALAGHTQAFKKALVSWKDIPTGWEHFPYYLGTGTRTRLTSTAFLHLKRPEYVRHVADISSMSNRVVLSGPPGSEICQEAVVRALTHEMQAQLLVVECLSLVADAEDPDDIPPLAEMVDIRRAGADGTTSTDDMDDEDLETWPGAEERGDKQETAQHVPWRSAGALGALSSIRRRSQSYAARFGAGAAAREARRAGRGSAPAGPPPVLHEGDRVKFVGHSASGLGRHVGDWSAHWGPQFVAVQPHVQSFFYPSPGGLSPPAPPAARHDAAARAAAAAAAIAGQAAAVASPLRGPWQGCKGRVVITFDDNPEKVGVRFDTPVPGGTNLGHQCEDHHGFFCRSADLIPEGQTERPPDSDVVNAMFAAVAEAAETGPVIVLLKDLEKDLEKILEGRAQLFGQLARQLDTLAAAASPVMFVASSVTEARKERGGHSLFAGALGGAPGMTLDLSFIEGLGARALGGEDRTSRPQSSKGSKLLAKLLPNRIVLSAPHAEPELGRWRKQLEEDTALLRQHANQAQIKAALTKCDLQCSELETLMVRDPALTADDAEKIVCWALAEQLQSLPEPSTAAAARAAAAPDAAAAATPDPPAAKQPSKLQISARCLTAAIETLKATQAEAQPSKLPFKDVQTENDFEKRLLAEVIPPDEVGVGFDDIGALEHVKTTLREVVMLPLQRPELFARGTLTKPTKGVLLFGPPGTGKTMLAKAVASESGANFLNISMSALASKWFGEGEKYVRALFSLASKLAPSVVFIDEVDSMLARRDKSGEHEAMRKIKNEFMANWDGLRTNQHERVLVLAATNRPMDLDEAVIRRMPRRLMVDLPDAANRVKILKVILKDEVLDPKFSFEELAALTDGYTGSDLRNLCVAAAYRPIRDFLAAEKDGNAPADDMREAMKQVGASVSSDAGSTMAELRQWNETYGEGGSRKTTSLTYFM